MIKRLLQTAALGVALTAASFGAQALPIGLALVIDESGSIGQTNYNTQIDGYVAALNNVLPIDGSVAVSVTTFDASSALVTAMTLIDSQAALDSLTADIFALKAAYNGGATCVSCGIATAVADMDSFGYGNLEKAVIDVSTDGAWNRGVNPDGPASDWVNDLANLNPALEGNVNCLGVGGSADCSFIAGPNSFSVSADTFADIQRVLENKIRRETGQIPVPATLALFGLGLLVMGVARKRRQA